MENKEKYPEIAQRVGELMRTLGIKNASELAAKIGGTPAKYYKLIQGKVRPEFETLAEINRAFPQVNGDWLLNGRGSILHEEGETPTTPPPAPSGGDDFATRVLEKAYADARADLERERVEKDRLFKLLERVAPGREASFRKGVAARSGGKVRSMWPVAGRQMARFEVA